jgi:hypothetical protein
VCNTAYRWVLCWWMKNLFFKLNCKQVQIATGTEKSP